MMESKWVGEMAEIKKRRQAEGVKNHGHLSSYEGGLVVPGVIVGESLSARIKRMFRRHEKTERTALRAVE